MSLSLLALAEGFSQIRYILLVSCRRSWTIPISVRHVHSRVFDVLAKQAHMELGWLIDSLPFCDIGDIEAQ